MKKILALAMIAGIAGSPVSATMVAAQSDEVPMFCTIRAMGGTTRDYFVSNIFWGDYNNNLQYKNRFAAWVNAEYGSMGGQYASYCWYGDDEGDANYKRDRHISETRSTGNNVIITYWQG
jgi:hypothetical protein